MPRRSTYTPASGSVNIWEAKTHFSKLIRRVQAGEEIIVTKAGKPVAKLRPRPTYDQRRRGLPTE